MKFNKEDENYVYELISRNVKKYRKLKGWTQEKLAQEINYSLSFISGIESSYHQTFSLGAIWRISQALDVEFSKFCEDDKKSIVENKYIDYRCNTCGVKTKIPIKIARHLKDIYELSNNKDIPNFECINNNCNGRMFPIDNMDFK